MENPAGTWEVILFIIFTEGEVDKPLPNILEPVSPEVVLGNAFSVTQMVNN